METARARARIVREWRRHAELIARAARRLLPGARVYVFGSVVRGDATAGSDVDLLVVHEGVPDRAYARGAIRARMEELAGLPYYHPFEIHLATPEEAQTYLEQARPHIQEL